jgi:mannose-6-phosphate isomerase-like protein (cupin superfamily)
METYMWGDDQAGKVEDWIYISNDSLHQIIFGMESNGKFKHSDQYRTIFGADELLYVLSGLLIISNPESGETHKIQKGESVFFRKDTWHHAFNYSNEYLQVLEFFSPPPISGTSGLYAKEKKLLEKSIYTRNNKIISNSSFKNQETFTIIKESDYVWSLEGPNQETLIGTMVKTEFLDVRMITIRAGQKSHIFQFDKNTSYLSLDDNLKVSLVNKESEYLVNKNDGLYFPASTSYLIENLNQFDSKIIVCIGL